MMLKKVILQRNFRNCNEEVKIQYGTVYRFFIDSENTRCVPRGFNIPFTKRLYKKNKTTTKKVKWMNELLFIKLFGIILLITISTIGFILLSNMSIKQWLPTLPSQRWRNAKSAVQPKPENTFA